MGIYDRDYYRRPSRGGFGQFVPWSITVWLIVINIVVFFADAATKRAAEEQSFDSFDEDGIPTQLMRPTRPSEPPFQKWGALSTAQAIGRGQVWRFISYQFLHADPWHLIVNVVGLYLFGPIVEGQFGGRRYLTFYLLCGLAGATCFVAMVYLHILRTGPNTPLVGASAGIFGLLIAAALIAPDVQIFYYFFPITIRLLAIVSMLVAAYTVLAAGYNAGGQAAHLGGGVLGFALMKNQHWLNWAVPARRSMSTRVGRSPRAMQKDWSKDFNR